MPGLTTERLALRRLCEGDAGLLRDYLIRNRSHLSPWEPQRNEEYYALEQCKLRLRSQALHSEAGSGVFFAVCRKQRMIGVCNFNHIVRGIFQACHLGYAIDREHEGQGYMFEAVHAGIQHMFTEQGLHRIMANYMPHNQRSAALLQRLGFQLEGYARDYLKINGVWADHVLTALLNPDA